MRNIILLLLAMVLFGCGPPPKYLNYRDAEYSAPKEDPLLESIRFYREQDCLRRCAEGKLCEDRD